MESILLNLRNKKPMRSKWIFFCSGKAVLWDIDSDPEDHEQCKPLFHIDQCFYTPPNQCHYVTEWEASHTVTLDMAPLHSGALWKCPGWSLSCQIIYLRPELQKNGQTSILIMSYPMFPFFMLCHPLVRSFSWRCVALRPSWRHTSLRQLFSLIPGKGARQSYVRRVRSLKPEAPWVQISK